MQDDAEREINRADGRAAACARSDAPACDRFEDIFLAEAVHRAKNLAQLEIYARRGRPGAAPDRAERTDRLAAAYARLFAAGRDDEVPRPCRDLHDEIARGLTALFGARACEIDLHLELDETHLPGLQRQALILISGELIVNAIKHAFPQRPRGRIVVRLVRFEDRALLSVRDDGVGHGPHAPGGQGVALVEGLCRVLDGSLMRVSTAGRGSCTSVAFQLR